MTARLLAALAALAMVTAYAPLSLAQQPQGGARPTDPNAPRSDAGGLRVPLQTDEDGQPRNLPALPSGMTMAMIQQGDSLFHGKAGCFTCHNNSGTGISAGGSSLTGGLAHIAGNWTSIDSLITAGVPEAATRTPVAMPPRGAQSNLTPQETRLVAAYVWAIATVRGEPWRPGGRERTRPQVGAGTTTAAAPAADTAKAGTTKAADTAKTGASKTP